MLLLRCFLLSAISLNGELEEQDEKKKKSSASTTTTKAELEALAGTTEDVIAEKRARVTVVQMRLKNLTIPTLNHRLRELVHFFIRLFIRFLINCLLFTCNVQLTTSEELSVDFVYMGPLRPEEPESDTQLHVWQVILDDDELETVATQVS